ncbi:NADP-dependent oxidoreductase, partial [Streptomyces sp. NPDC006992]
MRAVIQESFGGPEVLRTVETDRPVPLGGEVLVRVRAVGVNPVDVAVRAGALPLLGPARPAAGVRAALSRSARAGREESRIRAGGPV